MADQARRDRESSMYCHACHHSWQVEGENLQCPACMSASTEIVSPDNDPHHFHNRQPGADATAPSAPAHERNTGSETEHRGDAPGNTNDSAAHPDGGFPPHFTLRFASPGGSQVTLVTFVLRNTTPPATENPPPLNLLGMQFFPPFNNIFPVAPPPTVNNTPPTEAEQNTQHQQPPNQSTDVPQADGQPQPQHPNTQDNAQEQSGPRRTLHAGIFASFLRSLFIPGADAVIGDTAFSQEAFDRVITQLREQVPIGGAPPASQAALDRLRVRELDEKMLARMGCSDGEGKEGEGKARCVVCVDDMCQGEQVAVLPCEHFFHGECVMPWLKVHNTCPVCRRAVEVEGEDGKGVKGADTGAAVPPAETPATGRREGADSMDCS